MSQNPITYLTFYRFKGFVPKYVAISAMGISKVWYPGRKSSVVNKILGTGSGIGFQEFEFGSIRTFYYSRK